MRKRARLLLLATPAILVLVIWTPLELVAQHTHRQDHAAHWMQCAAARTRAYAAQYELDQVLQVDYVSRLSSTVSSKPVSLQEELVAANAEVRRLYANPPHWHSPIPFIVGAHLSLLPLLIEFIRVGIVKYRAEILHYCANRRRSTGLCVKCGYDLRATPTRCPECGNKPVITKQRAIGSVEEPAFT